MSNAGKRLVSIDIFRGITVALMILVNSVDDNHGYWWLSHSNWNGCSLADLVFPFFIFIVGVSVALALTKQQQKGLNRQALLYKVSKRAIFLFALGLLINAYPNHFNWHSLRIMGVLQRIAICYFFSSIIFITTQVRAQILIIILLLIGYCLAMLYFPVPGFSLGNLSYSGNVAAYFDSLMLAPNHLFHGGSDPEGIFSTIAAITTALLGNLLGLWLLSSWPQKIKLLAMALAGMVLMGLGWLWGLSFPINKALWSSPYVLWTAGIASLCYAVCYYLVEIKGWRRVFKAFEIFGINAMTAFVIHVVYLKTQVFVYIKTAAGLVNLRTFITADLFPYASPAHASLYYGLSFTLLWLTVIVGYNKLIIKAR